MGLVNFDLATITSFGIGGLVLFVVYRLALAGLKHGKEVALVWIKNWREAEDEKNATLRELAGGISRIEGVVGTKPPAAPAAPHVGPNSVPGTG